MKCDLRKNDQKRKRVFISCDLPPPNLFLSVTYTQTGAESEGKKRGGEGKKRGGEGRKEGEKGRGREGIRALESSSPPRNCHL